MLSIITNIIIKQAANRTMPKINGNDLFFIYTSATADLLVSYNSGFQFLKGFTAIHKTLCYFSLSINPKIEKPGPTNTDNRDTACIIAHCACVEIYAMLNPNKIKAIPNNIFFMSFPFRKSRFVEQSPTQYLILYHQDAKKSTVRLDG